MKLFTHHTFGEPSFVASSHVITSVRVEEGPGHDHIHIWNRGGKAGTLTVTKGDGELIARRLFCGITMKSEEITND